MIKNKKITLEELAILVFEKNQATKQNKDRLLKLAKYEGNEEIIKRLGNELNFKRAKIYFKKLNINKDSFYKRLNEKSPNNNLTVLEMASYSNEEKYVNLLLKNNAIKLDPNKGGKALCLAIENDNKDIVEMLLKNNANINFQDENKYTALILAINKENIKIVNILLDYGADTLINAEDSNYFDKTALTIACTNYKNLEIIKLLLKKRKFITSFEMTYFFAVELLYNPDIIKLLSKILIKNDNLMYTVLMEIIMINSITYEQIKLGLSKDTKNKTQEELKKEADEYMKNYILIVCDNLIKNGVDINFKTEDGYTALKQAEDYKMNELVNLINSYINKKSLNLEGNIDCDEFFIRFLKTGLVLFTYIKNPIINFQLKKTEEINQYYHSDIGYLTISYMQISLYKNINEKPKIIQINKTTGNVLYTNHNPKRLVQLLTNFRQDTPIKYTTHLWDMNFKNEYQDFDGYMKRVKEQWEFIEDELKALSPRLHKKIYNFLINSNKEDANWLDDENLSIGWASLDGLREWCNDSKDPFKFPLKNDCKVRGKTLTTFGDVIAIFKQEIQIRRENDILENIFIDMEEKLDEELEGVFEFELVKLKAKTFYTYVMEFKDVIHRIFKMVKSQPKYNEIKIAVEEPNDSYYELKIIQKNSLSGSSAKGLLNIADGGDFSIIKKSLTNLCDFSIESSYGDENYRINYLSSMDENNIEILDEKPQGFTYILRFYR